MSLKRLIKEKKILEATGIGNELVLPGEPMIYSIKYSVGSRMHSTQFFRDQKWRSLIKSYFRAYFKTSVPTALVVRFYVSPPSNVSVKPSDLKQENIPAAGAYEVADYLLSFLEMLHSALVKSYRQFASISVEKFYSSNPRTVFQFMHWNQYVKLQGQNPVHPKAKGVGASSGKRILQPKRKGNEQNAPVCERPAAKQGVATVERPSSRGCTLPHAGTIFSTWKKTPTAAHIPPHKKA